MSSYVLGLEKAVRKAVFYALEKVGVAGLRKTSMFPSSAANEPKWKLEDIYEILKSGDHRVITDEYDSLLIHGNLFIYGFNTETGWEPDIRISIVDNRIRMWWREPMRDHFTMTDFDVTWRHEQDFDNIADLVDAIYEIN